MIDMDQIRRNVVRWGRAGEHESPAPAVALPAEPAATGRGNQRGTPATIGASIRFCGELTGEEDFLIQGEVEGSITLAKNHLTIGESGRVRADVEARTIVVEGELHGDLLGHEKVVIKKTGRVRGNIVSPRVTLEDGAKFKGSIEMDPQSGPAAQAAGSGEAADRRRA